MFSNLLQQMLFATELSLSIAISDGIEFFTNPLVHKVHNCPDIMGMDWKNYRFWHASMSGWLCAWWLIYPAFLIIPVDPMVIHLLVIFNILLPLVYLVIPANSIDNSFLGHQILYTINPIGIMMACFIHFGEMLADVKLEQQ